MVRVGPGQAVGALLRSAGGPPQGWPMVTATLPAAGDARPAGEVLADALARLWLLGVDIDWTAHHAGAAPGRIPLPTYPFQRQRYWIDPAPAAGRPCGGGAGLPAGEAPGGPLEEFDRIPLLPEEEWLHVPVWRQAAATAPVPEPPSSWLVYAREGTADRLLAELREATRRTRATVTVVRPGAAYRRTPDGCTVRPGNVDDTLTLLRTMRSSGVRLERVVHLWSLDEDRTADGTTDGPADVTTGRTLELGLHTLVALARAAGELGLGDWQLDIVASGSQRVLEDHEIHPDAATLTGPTLLIPMEYPSVHTRLIDVSPAPDGPAVIAELHRPATGRTVALRGPRRWLPGYETLPPADLDHARR